MVHTHRPMLAAAPLILFPALAHAYSWHFQASPKQCSDLTIDIDGTDGKPPYRVLILPFGPSPLPNNIEARKIQDVPFDGSATSVTFKLNYPENSQFVAVVSDSQGFGSGGTSVAAQVTGSSDSSCFDSSKNVQPDFFFNIEPPNQIVQCQDTRLWWDNTNGTIQGIPIFQGVIPGGQSFSIPRGTLTNITGQGTGFTWKPNLRGGTTLIIVAGDDRGNGTAGSSLNLVGSGINNDGSCLDSGSPSSTPGSPAGGSYPTSTDGSGVSGGGSGSSGGSKTNVGAIVGGIIGGLAFLIILALLLLFFKRRRRLERKQKERPVDLLNADEDGDESPQGHTGRNDLPQYYEPEPFLVPDPTVTSADGHTSERPLSGSIMTSRSGTPDLLGGYAPSMTTTTTRKGGVPRPMRPVNIIQHDDAGPSAGEEGAETIELPPAYTNIKKGEKTATEAAPPAAEGEGETPPPPAA